MHYAGQYLEKLKVLSSHLISSHLISPFTHTWHHISALESFLLRIFLQELIPNKNCGAKLVTMTNQPDPRPPPIFSAYSQAKHFFLFNQLKNLTVTNLVETFKSKMLSCKLSISERVGNGRHLKNESEPKHKTIKIFPHKINAPVLTSS